MLQLVLAGRATLAGVEFQSVEIVEVTFKIVGPFRLELIGRGRGDELIEAGNEATRIVFSYILTPMLTDADRLRPRRRTWRTWWRG